MASRTTRRTRRTERTRSKSKGRGENAGPMASRVKGDASPPRPAPERPAWGVFVYLAGDNEAGNTAIHDDLNEILRAGGIAPGGFNFDAKLRRQSTDRSDLFHAHIGGLDTLARALLVAADLIERDELGARKDARYAGWDGALGQAILGGGESLESLEAKVAAGEVDPRPVSGGQESLENVVNQRIWSTR